MSGKQFIQVFILALSIICSSYFTHSLYHQQGKRQSHAISKFANLPRPLILLLSGEFKGAIADYLLMKIMIYHGELIDQNISPTKEDWFNTYKALQATIALDPRFLDPYVLAETTLPWDAGMVHETNELLISATRHRPFDFQPYYFLFFNHFYFLKDSKAAFPYIREASKRPNSPPYFKNLAARMAYYAGDTKAGILFLEEMLSQTTDDYSKKLMTPRLDALRKIDYLETKIAEFIKRYKYQPRQLQNLVSVGIIPEIPQDPYGGEFYIDNNGRVYSTSKFAGPIKNNN